MKCPHCQEECDREEVDIGVGIMHGPWGCPNCGWSEDRGWSEDPRYDSRDGVKHDGEGRVLDQYGVSHHVTRPAGKAVLAGMNVANRGCWQYPLAIPTSDVLRQAVAQVILKLQFPIGSCELGWGVLHPLYHSERWWQP